MTEDVTTQAKPLSPRSFGALGFAAAIAALALDQAHKYWMIDICHIGTERVAVTSYLDLVLVWNRGISYGLLAQNSEAGRFVLISFSMVMAVILSIWMVKASTRLSALSLGLIVGGALGNAADRIIHGAVADFFSFHYAGYYWYIFNVADVMIGMGVAGLLLDWIFKPSSRAS